MSSTSRNWLGAIAAVVVIGCLATVAIVASRPQPSIADTPGGPIRVNANLDQCGKGWADSQGGRISFAVTNSSLAGMEVYLENASTGAVYAELERLGSGATANFDVALGNGRYRFACLGDDSPATAGPTVTISGARAGAKTTPGVLPVTANELYPAAKSYSAWVVARLSVLRTKAERLEASIAARNPARAKLNWLDARDQYEQLGAAYGAFGDLDTAINGEPANGTTDATDPSLTGFRRIEYLLWAGKPLADALRPARQLVVNIQTLRTTFAATRFDPLDVGLRAHEILEDAVQNELNGGVSDRSGTALATVAANVRGTQQVLSTLTGILTSRGYDVAATDAVLQRALLLADSYRDGAGRWQRLSHLSTSQREELDSVFDQAVEDLAPIAAICDVRRAANS